MEAVCSCETSADYNGVISTKIETSMLLICFYFLRLAFFFRSFVWRDVFFLAKQLNHVAAVKGNRSNNPDSQNSTCEILECSNDLSYFRLRPFFLLTHQIVVINANGRSHMEYAVA
jgi:hypothetical protein